MNFHWIYKPFLACLFIVQIPAYAQTKSFVKQSTIGIHFILNDFRKAGVPQEQSYGATLSYTKGLNKHLEISSNWSGSFPDYPMAKNLSFNKKSFLLETNGMLNCKLLNDRYPISPYISGGIGASKYLHYYGLVMPAGIGIRGRFRNETFIVLNAHHYFGLSRNTTNHFQYTLGLAGNIARKKKMSTVRSSRFTTLNEISRKKDSDGDGIEDGTDECPSVAGLAQFKGCPDSDYDGIPDKEDSCLSLKGIIRLNGCPVADSDNDGVNDENDLCPNVRGASRYQGCPIPDKDHDGVNDEIDKCPDLPGLIANAGCPDVKDSIIEQVNLAARNIFFATASYELIKSSTVALDNLARILNKYKDLKIQISGHTDSVGSKEKNLILSQQRANTIKIYLINKGIESDRLEPKGLGAEYPIDTNDTPDGRAKNRRVEIIIKSF